MSESKQSSKEEPPKLNTDTEQTKTDKKSKEKKKWVPPVFYASAGEEEKAMVERFNKMYGNVPGYSVSKTGPNGLTYVKDGHTDDKARNRGQFLTCPSCKTRLMVTQSKKASKQTETPKESKE